MRHSANEALQIREDGVPQSRRYPDCAGPDELNQVVSAFARLNEWLEGEDFQGWDPYDALNSPLLRGAGRQRLLGIAFVQLLRRSPINLRPLLRIPKGCNPKAMGLFLATYAHKFLSTRKQGDLKWARFFHDWLIENISPGYAGACWGYNFDWPNRGFVAPAGTPTIVNTVFIALSFLHSERVFEYSVQFPDWTEHERFEARQEDGDGRNAEGVSVARSACNFILHDLNVLRPNSEELCFSYTPIDHRFVHNANMLGAQLFSTVYVRTGESQLAELALAAARFTARRQRPDGSWPYGIARRDKWVDNFHTGYVLVALKQVAAHLGTHEFDHVIGKGYTFWKKEMFLSEVVPKFYPQRIYPIDIHSVAQAVLTWIEFSDIDPCAIPRAWQLALWAIEEMQDETGFFYYQLHRTHRIRIPYMRWSQAWMQRAFTCLLAYCGGESMNSLGTVRVSQPGLS